MAKSEKNRHASQQYINLGTAAGVKKRMRDDLLAEGLWYYERFKDLFKVSGVEFPLESNKTTDGLSGLFVGYAFAIGLKELAGRFRLAPYKPQPAKPAPKSKPARKK